MCVCVCVFVPARRCADQRIAGASARRPLAPTYSEVETSACHICVAYPTCVILMVVKHSNELEEKNHVNMHTYLPTSKLN